jgi:hypothetical protein
MTGDKPHPLWSVGASELAGMEPAQARDLIVRCFFEAQKETFARAQSHFGPVPDDASLLATVQGAVRLAFREAGGDFDHPTVRALNDSVNVLARKAASWGTPAEVIAHHKGEIEKVLKALMAAPAGR